MEETTRMVPVLRVITIGQITLQSNAESLEELAVTIKSLLSDEVVKEYINQEGRPKEAPGYTR